MSIEYVITFHTHYEALVCKRKLETINNEKAGKAILKLIPVPRELSSSCGTALKVSVEEEFKKNFFDAIECDQVFVSIPNGAYLLLQKD